MLLRVLQREADLAGLVVDPLDPHADLLPFLHDFAGMLDALPGELADVNQAIDAAHIHERAEVVKLADRPLAHLPGCNSASSAFFDSSFSRSRTARRLSTRLPRRSFDFGHDADSAFARRSRPRFRCEKARPG